MTCRFHSTSIASTDENAIAALLKLLLLSGLESWETTLFKDGGFDESNFISPWLTHSSLPSWPTCSLPLVFLIREGSIEFPFISVYNAAAISLWQAGLTKVSGGITPLVLSFALWSSFITSTQMKSQDSKTVACPELLFLSLAAYISQYGGGKKHWGTGLRKSLSSRWDIVWGKCVLTQG